MKLKNIASLGELLAQFLIIFNECFRRQHLRPIGLDGVMASRRRIVIRCSRRARLSERCRCSPCPCRTAHWPTTCDHPAVLRFPMSSRIREGHLLQQLAIQISLYQHCCKAPVNGVPVGTDALQVVLVRSFAGDIAEVLDFY